ncbi:hypothetical protein PINS_up014672 [Pythium insidiosum]|nr:hypothetical protein PINS_up014672 [Pythium insidiosum]
MEPKRFLHELSRGKIKQICVLIVDDEHVDDIRSLLVDSSNEGLHSSSSMDESVLDD